MKLPLHAHQLLVTTAAVSLFRISGCDAVAFFRGQTNANSIAIAARQNSNRQGMESDNSFELLLRGGATKVAATDEDEAEVSSLAKATKTKVKSKRTKDAKKAFNKELGKSTATGLKKTSKKKSKFRIPYIVRAMCNPFAVVAMTKAYWASLFDLNYLDDVQVDPSQELRSALEAKAKRGSGGGSKGKRKMRRGQAKTLNDLPQLNT